MTKTIEQRVGEAVLQQPKEFVIGNKTFIVAPPSVSTLILVSEAISLLPQVQLDKAKIVEEVLFVAKDCRILGDIAAILILGAKGLKETVTTKRKHFFGLFTRSVNETVDRKAELSKWLLEELDTAQLNKLIFELLKDFNLGDFFGTTTFLIEINLLRPTKVVETTASGLS
nr:MAG TPA: hypothetical protein [Caudoviricetes sp.]